MNWVIVSSLLFVVVLFFAWFFVQYIQTARKMSRKLYDASNDLDDALNTVVSFSVNKIFDMFIEQMQSDGIEKDVQQHVGKWKECMRHANDENIDHIFHNILSEVEQKKFLSKYVQDTLNSYNSLWAHIKHVKQLIRDDSLLYHVAIQSILKKLRNAEEEILMLCAKSKSENDVIDS